jgi:hypothetical protein
MLHTLRSVSVIAVWEESGPESQVMSLRETSAHPACSCVTLSKCLGLVRMWDAGFNGSQPLCL